MNIHLSPIQRKSLMTALFSVLLLTALTACGSEVTPTPSPTEDPVSVPAVTPTPVSFNVLWESSPHADEKAEAFRHWDAATPQEIPPVCASCHSRTGFIDFIGADGTAKGVVETPAKIGTTITCYVCHNEVTYTLDNVTFPSGVRVGGLGPEARCLTCHLGRGSTSTLDIHLEKAGATEDDSPYETLTFLTSHYTSGATPFGSEVHGAYEYGDNNYQGFFNRGEEFFSCIRCHDQHSLKLKIETCGDCHTFDGKEAKNIRVNTTDFDGDGNITEGAYYEVEQFKATLLTAIQNYARDMVQAPIVYDFGHYPYYYKDTNGNGAADPEEIKPDNIYKSWTPRLLKAAYNYNYAMHDAGAFAHNSIYILQMLYDSLEDVGGDTSGMTRP